MLKRHYLSFEVLNLILKPLGTVVGEGPLSFLGRLIVVGTDSAAVDGDGGAADGVSILTTAINGAVDERIGIVEVALRGDIRVIGADGDVGVVDIGHRVVDGVDGANVASAGAEDHTIVLARGTQGAAGDGDIAVASGRIAAGVCLCSRRMVAIVGGGKGINLALDAGLLYASTNILMGNPVVAHGGHIAAAIDMVLDDNVGRLDGVDGDVGVAVDKTCRGGEGVGDGQELVGLSIRIQRTLIVVDTCTVASAVRHP